MKKKLSQSIILIGIIWIIHLVDIILPFSLNHLGIQPRSISGLSGILLAPFLHGNFSHLISNSLPLFVLTFTLLVMYPRISILVWTMITIIGGLMVWIFARSALHIGASGVIFGLTSFFIATGIFRRSFKSILIAIAIFFLYGGIIWGILPGQEGVSWEAHLFGFLSGIFTAWIFKNPRYSEEKS